MREGVSAMIDGDPIEWAVRDELEEMWREGPIVGLGTPPAPETRKPQGWLMPPGLADYYRAQSERDAAPVRAEDVIVRLFDGSEGKVTVAHSGVPKKVIGVGGTIVFRAYIQGDGTWVYLESPCKEGL